MTDVTKEHRKLAADALYAGETNKYIDAWVEAAEHLPIANSTLRWVPPSALIRIAQTIADVDARDRWRPVFDEDDNLLCHEGKSYLFAIQVSTNGAPYAWEYFRNAIIWDAETPPDFQEDPGWSVSEDGLYFRELPAPPEAP